MWLNLHLIENGVVNIILPWLALRLIPTPRLGTQLGYVCLVGDLLMLGVVDQKPIESQKRYTEQTEIKSSDEMSGKMSHEWRTTHDQNKVSAIPNSARLARAGGSLSSHEK